MANRYDALRERASGAKERVIARTYGGGDVGAPSKPKNRYDELRERVNLPERDTTTFNVDPSTVKTGGVSESRGAREMQEKRTQGAGFEVPTAAIKPAQDDKGINTRLGEQLREVPVLGSIYRGLDWLQEKTEPAANIAQEYYTPGAGLTALGAAERGAFNLAGKLLPKAAPIVQRAVTEAGVGGFAGAGQSLAAHPEEGFRGAAINAGIGTAGGAATPFVGRGIKVLADKTGLSNALRGIFSRNGGAVPEELSQEILALPEGRNRPPGVNILPSGDEPIIAGAGATTARTGTRANPWRDKYNQLIGLAHEYKFTPGREMEELEQLWSSIAGKEDPGLDELIQRAHPTYFSKAKPGLVSKARATQQAREVAGAPLPVRTGEERLGLPVRAPETTPFQMPEPVSEVVQPVRTSRPIVPPVRGAATSSPRPQQRGVRANFATQADSGKFTPEAQQAIAGIDQEYNVANNADTVARANKALKNAGQAEKDFLNNKFIRQGDNAGHTALGYRLMQELDAAGEFERLAVISAKLAEDLTKQGQGIQAASLIKRLSPEGQLIALTRVAEENGLTVTPDDTKAFLDNARVAKEAGAEPLRQNTLIDVLDALDAGKAPTPEDIAAVSQLAERARKYVPSSAKRDPVVRQPRKRDIAVERLGKAAQAAEKRIEARRTQGFLPKGGSDFVDYGIILAHDLVKKAVNQANYVEYVVNKWGEPYRQHAGKILNIAKREILRHPELREKEVQAVEDIVEKWTKSTPATTSDAKKIKELADSLKSLQGKQGKEANVAIQQIMNKYDKGSVLDKIQAVRYMAMLGNTLTQGINATSGLAKAQLDNFIDLFGWMVDGLVSTATKRDRSTTAIGMNPFQYIGGIFKNAGEGITSNWKGVTPGGLTDPSEINGLAFKGSNPISKVFQLGERSLRAIAGGADYMTYRTQFDNEIYRQARLSAAKDTSGAPKKSIIEKFVNNPPPEAIELADTVGRRATFQQKNSLGSVAAGAVSKLGNVPGAGKVPGKIAEQAIRATLPFIRTPLNIAQTAIQMTPVGATQGLYGIIRAGTPAEQRLAVQNLGLGLTGTGLGALGWFLSDAGIITGSNDSGDKELDAIREQAGKGKYRFNQDGAWRLLKSLLSGNSWDEAKEAAKYKEGDTTFDYNRLQPLTFPVAVGAGAKEGGASGGVGEGVNSILNLSSLTGLQNLFATQPSGSTTEKNASLGKKFIEGYIKSFSPSLLAQEARRQDTTQRQTPYNKGIVEDIVGYQKSRTPGLSKTLPAKITTLGEEKEGASGIWRNYVNPYRSDEQAFSKAASIISDLIDRTGNEKLAPSGVPKKIDIGDKTVELTPRRYEQYQRDVGKEIATKVSALPTTLTDEQLTRRIEKIQEDVKEKYRRRIKVELRKQQ